MGEELDVLEDLGEAGLGGEGRSGELVDDLVPLQELPTNRVPVRTPQIIRIQIGRQFGENFSERKVLRQKRRNCQFFLLELV